MEWRNPTRKKKGTVILIFGEDDMAEIQKEFLNDLYNLHAEEQYVWF